LRILLCGVCLLNKVRSTQIKILNLWRHLSWEDLWLEARIILFWPVSSQATSMVCQMRCLKMTYMNMLMTFILISFVHGGFKWTQSSEA
jgi:hypothetical protein